MASGEVACRHMSGNVVESSRVQLTMQPDKTPCRLGQLLIPEGLPGHSTPDSTGRIFSGWALIIRSSVPTYSSGSQGHQDKPLMPVRGYLQKLEIGGTIAEKITSLSRHCKVFPDCASYFISFPFGLSLAVLSNPIPPSLHPLVNARNVQPRCTTFFW